MMNKWYWFGVLVDPSLQVKLRQVHVVYREGTYRLEVWSKGIAGKLWYVRLVDRFQTFDLALEHARAEMLEWCQGYTTVDEGEPPQFNRAPHDEVRSAEGWADPDWWAGILQVDPAADLAAVKSAFRRRAMEAHPDRGGTDDEMRQVLAAWECIKSERGW